MTCIKKIRIVAATTLILALRKLIEEQLCGYFDSLTDR